MAPPLVGLERARLLCVLRYRVAVRCVNGMVSVGGLSEPGFAGFL